MTQGESSQAIKGLMRTMGNHCLLLETRNASDLRAIVSAVCVATLANTIVPQAGCHRRSIILGSRTLHFSAMVGRSAGNDLGSNAKITSDGATTTVPLVPHNPAFLSRCRARDCERGAEHVVASWLHSSRRRLLARTDGIRGATEHFFLVKN